MLSDSVHITPVKFVRDLGIYIDGDLSMWMHVKKTVSCCFAALRQLRQIRQYVPTSTFQKLVDALVYSWLDCSNGVLVGIPAHLMRRLRPHHRCTCQPSLAASPGVHTLYSIRLQYWATKSFTIPHRDTWDHSLVLLTYLVDEHSALPAPIAWNYLISNFPPSAAELLRLLPQRSRTITTRHSRFGINTPVVPAPIENFFISMILYLLAL